MSAFLTSTLKSIGRLPVLLAVCLALMPAPLLAAPAAESLALARELVSATTPATAYARMLQAERQRFTRAFNRENPGKRGEVVSLFDEVAKPILDRRYGEVLERRAQHFAETMSPDLLRATLAFYRSPNGQALAAAQRDPLLSEDVRSGVRSRLSVGELLGLPGRINRLEKVGAKAGLPGLEAE